MDKDADKKITSPSPSNVQSIPLSSFDESADDNEVISKFFQSVDSHGNKTIPPGGVLAALNKIKERAPSSQGLDELIKIMRKSESAGMDLQEFASITEALPRFRGHRIQWAQSLRLDYMLARHLKVGDLFDELAGLKSMTDAEVDASLKQFLEDVSKAVRAELANLKKGTTIPDQKQASVTGKFCGFTGKFGEAILSRGSLEGDLGRPDPMLLKTILRENVLAADASKPFKVPNCSLVTSDLWEYARLLGNPLEYKRDAQTKLDAKDIDSKIPIILQEIAKSMHTPAVGPNEAELKELISEFQLLKQLHQEILGLSLRGKFPGDDGDVQFSADFSILIKDAEHAKAMAPQITQLADKINADRDSSAFVEAAAPNLPGDTRIIVTVWIVRFSQANFDLSCQTNTDVESAFDGFKKQEFEKLKTAFIRQLGVPVDITNERGFVCCPCVDEPSLRKYLEKLTPIELNKFAGCEAESRQKCTDLAVTAFHEETEKWRAKHIIRVQGRKSKTLRQLMSAVDVQSARLRVEEAIQAHMCTGPMCQVTVSYSIRNQPYPSTMCTLRW